MRHSFLKFSTLGLAVAIYGTLLGFDVAKATETEGKNAQNVKEHPQATSTTPEPGSEGDTLTVVDKRMAYLVYKLMDKDGKIKGADIKRGEKLFYQNCRPCHGEDGHRINFTPGRGATFIGQRARYDMPTFWYQMNFGDDERNMAAYYDEIPLDEMVDIAGFAQTLP